MRLARILAWAMVALALAASAVLLLWPRFANPSEVVTRTASVDFGGPFMLVGADGRPFASSRLAGKPHAIFFGFTHCPDVCPTTLARLVRLRQQIGPGEPFRIVFVTVDPERDGPAEVGKYSELFNAPITGLTGSPAQIAEVKKQFGIFSQKVPDESGGYSVDHSASVLLFDRAGKFTSTIAPEEGDTAALAKLKRIAA